MEQRLQRIVAAAGLTSRRGAEAWIEAGRVTVNGKVASLGDRADPDRDVVCVDGEPIRAERLRYWLMHKPRGVLTTLKDERATREGRPTVLDLLPPNAKRERVFPVGRLDAESEGLLLLTNDGAIAHALLHPSLGTEKEYRVTVEGQLSQATAEALARGPMLDDGPMAPCEVTAVAPDPTHDRTTLHLTLREGRKRQIRRALAGLGHPVLRLVRVRMGPLELGALGEGAVRALDAAEVERLRQHAGARRAAAPPAPNHPRSRGNR